MKEIKVVVFMWQFAKHFHHIYYRSERKDLIDNIDNGIMLCVYCHDKVHSNKKKWQPILLNMMGDVLDDKK